VVFLYFGLSYVVIGLLNKSHSTEVTPIIEVINIVGGGVAGFVAGIISVFIVFINLNAWVWGASRSIYSASKDDALPKFLSRVNKYGTPYTSALYVHSDSVNCMGDRFNSLRNLRLKPRNDVHAGEPELYDHVFYQCYSILTTKQRCKKKVLRLHYSSSNSDFHAVLRIRLTQLYQLRKGTFTVKLRWGRASKS